VRKYRLRITVQSVASRHFQNGDHEPEVVILGRYSHRDNARRP
jgi:hypothetical protein